MSDEQGKGETWEKRHGQSGPQILMPSDHDWEVIACLGNHTRIVVRDLTEAMAEQIVADHERARVLQQELDEAERLHQAALMRGATWAAKAGLMGSLFVELLNSKYLLPAGWAKRAAKQAQVHWDADRQLFIVDDEGGIT